MSFSEATSNVIAVHLRDEDVAIYLDNEVEEITGDGHAGTVITTDKQVPIRMVLLGTGVYPGQTWLKKSVSSLDRLERLPQIGTERRTSPRSMLQEIVPRQNTSSQANRRTSH